MNGLNICVVGVGGVGGYFGGKLAHAFPPASDSPARIFFLARGKHLEAITRNGLLLESPELGKVICKPTLATQRMSDLPEIDISLISVKGYDLMEVGTLIKNYVKENTIVLPLLNGADIYERIRNEIKTGIILPACVYVSARIEEPGVVVQIGKPGKIIFGKDPEHTDYMPHDILRLFDKSSIDCEWKDDASPAIWEKYVFIASFGLVSARYDRTLGEILDEPSLREETAGIMSEVCSIALKKDIRLPEGLVDISLRKAATFPRDTQTSLQRDIRQKRGKSELELLGGTIVDLGKRLGIPTPTTEKIYHELEGI